MSSLRGVVTNLNVAVKNVQNGAARSPEVTDVAVVLLAGDDRLKRDAHGRPRRVFHGAHFNQSGLVNSDRRTGGRELWDAK